MGVAPTNDRKQRMRGVGVEKSNIIQASLNFDQVASEHEPTKKLFSHLTKQADTQWRQLVEWELLDINDAESVQGILDFSQGHGDGLQNWYNQREDYMRAIRNTWLVPVGRRVRLEIRNQVGEFVGDLKLAIPPSVLSRKQPLHLKLGRMGFLASDVLNCMVVESSSDR